MKKLEVLCRIIEEACSSADVDFIFITEDGYGKTSITKDEKLRELWRKIEQTF